ncbi:hypothetical protein QQS21_002145 [Conoideocrella luteorostrata]|uniref:Antigenic cell wall galactomannoprotein n=1 Tax=Conoideocrella luteorostrata TaxID=1105319 RepID=A0AAJ0G1K7_9HYPO|nr:hypothetical protein QQS21_002145 [Conoideocrella luteorostrata]
MLFLPLLLQLLVCVVATTPVRRDGESITAALETISKQLVTVNNTLNTFNGGLAGTKTALQIQGQVVTLQKDIDGATATSSKSAALNDEESASVAVSINSLTHDIFDVLDNITRKKPQFDKAILGIASASFLVKSDLQHLQKATDEFGAALTEKLVKSIKDVAPLLISSIDFRFQRALKVYA